MTDSTDTAPAETEAPAPRLTRAQLTEQVAFYRALAAAAADREKEYKDRLASQAQDEWRTEGAAPSWRVASMGVVSSAVTQDAVVVNDERALLAWAKKHKPDEVETVERVTQTYRNALLKNIRTDPKTGKLVNAAGAPVDGVALVPGGHFKGISFLFSDETKATYEQVAAEALSRIALRTEPAEPAPVPGAAAGDALDAFAAFA